MSADSAQTLLRKVSGEIRVLPVVIVATAALLGLKALEIAADAPGAIGGMRGALAQSEQAADAEPAAGDTEQVAGEDGMEAAQAPMETAAADTTADDAPMTAEQAINVRLGERRKELEGFERDLKLRENLLKAAELRIEQRLKELKSLEDRLNATIQERDEQEQQRFKNLISMYEAMKPKDAARVFDQLDTRALVEIATGLDPRKMGEIMAKMTADGAERLTIALMNKAAEAPKSIQVEDLPEIVGTQPAS